MIKRGLLRSTVLAGLMVSCASSKGVSVLAQDPVDQDVDVTLSMKGQQCGLVKGDVRPDTIPAKRSRRDKVKWHVYNHNCPTLKEVKIVFDNGDAHPFDNTCSKAVTNLEQGKTKTTRCQLRSNANDGRHYYKIYINGVAAVDPDVEVWP